MAWTTPGTATAGEVLTAAFWNEQVRDNLQAVYTNFASDSKIDTQSTSVAAGATTTVTGLSISHAVASASNYVVLLSSVQLGSPSTADSRGFGLNILAGGSTVTGWVPAAAGSRSTVFSKSTNLHTIQMSCLVAMAVYTPGSTSPVTYGVQLKNVSSSTTTVYVNYCQTDGNAAEWPRGASGLFLWEFGG
jgi:hypothetical protein